MPVENFGSTFPSAFQAEIPPKQAQKGHLLDHVQFRDFVLLPPSPLVVSGESKLYSRDLLPQSPWARKSKPVARLGIIFYSEWGFDGAIWEPGPLFHDGFEPIREIFPSQLD
ncbi:hypothetical protein CDAR_236231 [Caerostris darwini]|uniref:Uncharacterized protein n=1 Tax=Caerostris darwini TaxID=1538125 RepID=A0AAV4TA83_9ARAC|nr:hypothetical protein CDAR_236231 [Caerostris darwini]